MHTRPHFDLYDLDGDGVLTTKDASTFLERLGADNTMPLVVSDAGIPFQDFSQHMTSKPKATTQDIFDLIDTDADGKINQKDIDLFVATFGGAGAGFAKTVCAAEGATLDDIGADVMARADKNSKGYLDVTDFQRVLATEPALG
ncbi:hypothetical protein CTAYLR_006332 [Chrysophaeum taylorii]|uniref:EF-hand domain-containing protein n=1 Tax=Chrysophaeum taylorii TaxID=2483200 RepID=A0AAD7UAQ4_9STRA|nr:hypothetical protein CTAYLR_006332 [Chrysophaeum taylorii]